MHLGLIGYGSIAKSLIGLLPADMIAQITVLIRPSAAKDTNAGTTVRFVTTFEDLLECRPDLMIECASHAAVAQFAADILASGVDLVVASVGAFADDPLHAMVTAAASTGQSKLIIPTGAIGGLDLLTVLALHDKVDVTYRGTKPPMAWKGSPADDEFDLDGMHSRTVIFAGSGREAAARYPKNANVVAALALSGAGFDTMNVELIADPQAQTNKHAYCVVSPLSSYSVEIENAASPGNARTSMTTVLSLLKEVTHYISADTIKGTDLSPKTQKS